MHDKLKWSAIPTLYRGIRYRSRLEARWAAFFDLMGWAHEYEPIDLPGWIPDFALRFSPDRRVLVEVKPLDLWATGFPNDVISKIDSAVRSDGSAEILILGEKPNFDFAITFVGFYRNFSHGDSRYTEAFLSWHHEGRGIWAFEDIDGEAFLHDVRFSDTVNGDQAVRSTKVREAEQDWRRASNVVQWRGQGESIA